MSSTLYEAGNISARSALKSSIFHLNIKESNKQNPARVQSIFNYK